MNQPLGRPIADNSVTQMLDTIFPPHQQRVIDERMDLQDKVTKLETFIASNPVFDSIGPLEQNRMRLQLMAMNLYLHILGDRIRAFTVTGA